MEADEARDTPERCGDERYRAMSYYFFEAAGSAAERTPILFRFGKLRLLSFCWCTSALEIDRFHQLN